MKKLRIRPVIDELGVSYIVESKGLFFWSQDKGGAGSVRHSSMEGSVYFTRHHLSVNQALRAIKEEHGKSWKVVGYKV